MLKVTDSIACFCIESNFELKNYKKQKKMQPNRKKYVIYNRQH